MLSNKKRIMKFGSGIRKLWIFEHFLRYQKFASPKTGGFLGTGNWFWPKSYTRQNPNVGRVPCKKPYSIWIKNKKVIQKIK